MSQNIVLAFVTDCYTLLFHEGKLSIKKLVLGGWVLGVCQFVFFSKKEKLFSLYSCPKTDLFLFLFIEPFPEHVKVDRNSVRCNGSTN